MKIRHVKSLILACETAWLVVCLLVFFRGGISVLRTPITLPWSHIVAAVCAFIVIMLITRLDAFRGGWRVPTIASQLILLAGLFYVALVIYSSLARQPLGTLLVATVTISIFFGFFAIRLCFRWLLSSNLPMFPKRRLVIVGHGRVAKELKDKISRHPELLCEVVGFLYPSESEPADGEARETRSCHQTMLQVSDILARKAVNEIILASSAIEHPETLNLVARCRQSGIQVSVIPQYYELYLTSPSMVNLGGLPLMRLNEHVPRASQLLLKRAFDLGFGVLAVVLSLPVMGIGALLVWQRYGGFLRTEERCGKGGRIFRMYRLNVDRNSPRLLGWERFLNTLSITELPQLFNVMRGEMSLLGPRPETPERVKRYSDWHWQRLSVRPGITGLAQVHGLREHHTSEEKARFDLQYILAWSFWSDCALLLETVWTLCNRLLTAAVEAEKALGANSASYSTPAKHGPVSFNQTAPTESVNVDRA